MKGWDDRADLAACAIRAIRDGEADQRGIASMAKRLGVSQRHLNRVLVAEVGATAQQLAQSRRAHTARALMDQTGWQLADIAFAAGFGSVRQFNAVMRAEFGVAPSRLRRASAVERPDGGRCRLVLRMPTPGAAAGDAMRAALAAHAVPGVERVVGERIERLITTASGTAAVAVDLRGHLEVNLPGLPALTETLMVVRRWLAIDADPQPAQALLGTDPAMGRLIDARPGLRIPGAVDGGEFALFTVLGQQISLAAATTAAARMVSTFGKAAPELGAGWTIPPAPDVLAGMGPDRLRTELRLTRARAATLHAVAVLLAAGLRLDGQADRSEVRRRLLAVKGVGEWTAEFIAMRALGDPDACPAGDLVLRRALGVAGGREVRARAESWRPWRAYAVMHLWTEASYLCSKN